MPSRSSLTLLAAAAAAPAALAAPAWDPTSFWSTWSAAAGSSGPSSKGTFNGNTHLVIVGGENGLVYDPPITFADPGDVVMFEFRFKNHTVTQSSFADPCTKVDGGFASGFQPVSNDTTNFPGFVVTVNDSKPLWFYCGQKLPTPHCPQGMVGAINPQDSNQFNQFLAAALALNGTDTSSSSSSGSSSSGSQSGSGSGSGSSGSASSSSTAPKGTTSSVSTGWQPGAKTHLVKVGGAAGLVYTPPVTYAAVGDQVVFEFSFNNHTVTQSSFNTPCTHLAGGFASGFQPVSNTSTSPDVPAFVVTVEDTNPIWIYCGQTGHCGKGMVGAINPPATGNTFDAFKAKALSTANATSSSTNGTRCNVASFAAPIPAGQTNLTAPKTPLAFVTLGRGTQNYTCTNGTFQNNQALAALFDSSCFAGQPIFNSLPAIAAQLDLTDPVGSASKLKASGSSFQSDWIDTTAFIMSDPAHLIGIHTFIPFPDATSKTASPKFDLSVATNNPNNFIVAVKTGSLASPDSPANDVAWLQLNSTQGGLTNDMYRLQTVGGQPPTSCSQEGQQTFIPYAASYMFASL